MEMIILGEWMECPHRRSAVVGKRHPSIYWFLGHIVLKPCTCRVSRTVIGTEALTLIGLNEFYLPQRPVTILLGSSVLPSPEKLEAAQLLSYNEASVKLKTLGI